MTAAHEKAQCQPLLPARSWTCRCSCGPARRWRAPWWWLRLWGGSRVGRPKPGGSLCASASCREWSIHDRGRDVGAAPAPTATNWGFPFVPNADLLVSAQICSKREFGFSAGNTSAQLVPRVFSLGSSSCCTLVTMLTIYPLVHHVMKKASNCVCSTLCTFHSSILKKTGITCMAIIIQFHDGWKSYSVLLGAVIISLVYTPWQSLCLPIQSSSSYTVKMCFWGQGYPKYFLMEVRKLNLLSGLVKASPRTDFVASFCWITKNCDSVLQGFNLSSNLIFVIFYCNFLTICHVENFFTWQFVMWKCCST